MNAHLSGTVLATLQAIPAALHQALQLDPLLSAVRLGLLPSASYDVAWDALEQTSPDRYQPDQAFADWLRANWRAALAGEFVPAVPAVLVEGEIVPYCSPSRALARGQALAKPWMEPFLTEYVRNGGVILRAAKVARVNRDTVAEHRKSDPAFARALARADEQRRPPPQAAS